MKSKLIVALATLALNSISYAADDQMPAKPQSGSATTAQESPAHPATTPSATSADKTGEGTTAIQSPTHPAAKGNDSASQAPKGKGDNSVRNWALIDTDKDNSISPDEMQKFLEKGWAATKNPS
jgi:hypothetical protein